MDPLKIIKTVLDQHKVIFGQLDIAQDSLNDIQALIQLGKANTDLTTGIRQDLSQKLDHIGKIIPPIDHGLRRHYTFEEEHLPPLLGPVLTDSLILEHKQILDNIEQTMTLLSSTKVEELTRSEEIKKESLIYEQLYSLRQSKLDHLYREEAILITLQKMLELRSNTGYILNKV